MPQFEDIVEWSNKIYPVTRSMSERPILEKQPVFKRPQYSHARIKVSPIAIGGMFGFMTSALIHTNRLSPNMKIGFGSLIVASFAYLFN